MKMRGVQVLWLAMGLLGCSEKVSPEQAEATQQAVVEAAAPVTIDEELSTRIALLSVDSRLSADLTLGRAKAATLRLVMDDGKRYTPVDLLQDAGKAKAEVIRIYADLIRDTPVDDLRDALKAGMAAEIAYYDTVLDASRQGEPRWLLAVQDAREVVRQTDSKIEAERLLARAK